MFIVVFAFDEMCEICFSGISQGGSVLRFSLVQVHMSLHMYTSVHMYVTSVFSLLIPRPSSRLSSFEALLHRKKFTQILSVAREESSHGQGIHIFTTTSLRFHVFEAHVNQRDCIRILGRIIGFTHLLPAVE